MDLPTRVTKVMMTTGQAYCTKTAGLTNIPTETKKIAPKRSFTGWMICSMCSASTVSARIDPIMKAPSAAENPVRVANTTIPRQSPSETISKVSLFISRFAFFKKNGRINIPIRNHRIRKKTTFNTLINSSSPTNSLLTAIVERMTIIRIAIRSSTTNVPNTTPVKRWLRKPRSSNALIIIVVDDIDNIPPRKIEFIVLQPNRCPTI